MISNSQKSNVLGIKYLVLLVSFIKISVEIQVLDIQTCLLTRHDNGTFFKCQIQQSCADQNPPSAFQSCSSYNYAELDQQTCRTQCCPSMDSGQTLTATDIQQCYTDWQQKQTNTILSIVLPVLLSIALLFAIGLTIVFGCVRNPYTNGLVWTGCLCCRKQVDFREYREALQAKKKKVQGETDGPMYKDNNAAP